MIVVLRLQGGLQVGGIVDGVPPGIGGQHFPMSGETPCRIDGESVVIGGAAGVVGDHVAEGNYLVSVTEVIVVQDLLRQTIDLWRSVVLQSCVEPARSEEAN